MQRSVCTTSHQSPATSLPRRGASRARQCYPAKHMYPNRVVAITGASAGIGRATALRVARDGASVVICARREALLQAVAREITAAGGNPLAIVADVSREDDMTQMVAQAVERFGRLDVILCNAGFAVAGAIDDISPEQMRQLMDVNYMGTFYAARAAMPAFRKQGRGHVIMVSSI